MDPGLEKAKILMAQANKPMAILRERSLRFEEMKALAFFEFITFDYIIENKEDKKELVHKSAYNDIRTMLKINLKNI